MLSHPFGLSLILTQKYTSYTPLIYEQIVNISNFAISFLVEKFTLSTKTAFLSPLPFWRHLAIIETEILQKMRNAYVFQ